MKTKEEMIVDAVENKKLVEFTFKKDGSYRVVEPYEYYLDDLGQTKVWAYQIEKDGDTTTQGLRCFIFEDMTYLTLFSETFKRRNVKYINQPPRFERTLL